MLGEVVVEDGLVVFVLGTPFGEVVVPVEGLMPVVDGDVVLVPVAFVDAGELPFTLLVPVVVSPIEDCPLIPVDCPVTPVVPLLRPLGEVELPVVAPV